MIKTFLSIFILTAFLLNLMSETVEVNAVNSGNLQVEKASATIDIGQKITSFYDCAGCADSDREEHHHGDCSHKCSGVHQFTISSYLNLLTKKLTNTNHKTWYYNSNYTQPLLDPSLKPPTFS